MVGFLLGFVLGLVCYRLYFTYRAWQEDGEVRF